MADQKARDIIDEIQVRGVCGESLQKKLGRRAWSRPRVAVSDRLYKQYRVPDPWDPEARKETTPIGLGPVSLRLGEKRRQPAPHLKPKPPKSKPKSLADSVRAQPRPKPTPKPQPKAPPVQKASLADAQAKDAKRAEEAARAEEVTRRMRQAEAARGKWVRATPEDAESTGSHKLPVRPDLDRVALAQRSDGGPAAAAPPRPKRSDGGRFRMQSRKVTSAPVAKPIKPDFSTEPTDEVPAPVPVRSRSMPSAAGGGMDDLFAAAAQMGRLSLRGNDAQSPEGSADSEE